MIYGICHGLFTKTRVFCFESWLGYAIHLRNGMVLKMVFYAITWIIWITRNEMVSRRKKWDKNQLFKLIKVRMAWWINVQWLNLNILIGDLNRCLMLGNNLGKKAKNKAIGEFISYRRGGSSLIQMVCSKLRKLVLGVFYKTL